MSESNPIKALANVRGLLTDWKPTSQRAAEAKFKAIQEIDAALSATEIHLNPVDHLPPVETPLLIELAPGRLMAATRTGFIEKRDREMEYLLANGTTIVGRFPWTYP